MRLTTKVRIVAISNLYSSLTAKSKLYSKKITVIEAPEINPYGRDYSNSVPFDIEVHNDNIDKFGIVPGHIGEVATVDLIVVPHKKDQQDATFQFLVNNIDFEI